MTTDVNLASKVRNCLPFSLINASRVACNVTVSECSMLKTLIPHFSISTYIMSILPWLLGAFIIFTRRDEFWKIFGTFTTTDSERFQNSELILKKFVFLIGLSFYPGTVYILLGTVQIF